MRVRASGAGHRLSTVVYSFRPRFSLGFGIYLGYPIAYPYDFGYPTYVYASGRLQHRAGRVEAAPRSTSSRIAPTSSSTDRCGCRQRAISVRCDSRSALVPGRHHVELQAPGLEPLAFDVDVIDGEVIPFAARFGFISSDPRHLCGRGRSPVPGDHQAFPTVSSTFPSDARTTLSDAPTSRADAPATRSDAPTTPSDAPTTPSDAPTAPSDAPTLLRPTRGLLRPMRRLFRPMRRLLCPMRRLYRPMRRLLGPRADFSGDDRTFSGF